MTELAAATGPVTGPVNGPATGRFETPSGRAPQEWAAPLASAGRTDGEVARIAGKVEDGERITPEEALHLHGQDVTGVPLEMDAVLESLLDQIEQSQREEVMVRPTHA